MDQAAMPVRIEKWRVAGKILYRVVGIMWSGYAVTNQTWTLWSPKAPGRHAINLHVDDPNIPTKRLRSGFYTRSVDIDEV